MNVRVCLYVPTYVYMYVCMYICICLYVCMYICVVPPFFITIILSARIAAKNGLYIAKSITVSLSIYIYINISIYIFIYLYKYIHLYLYLYLYLSLYLCVCVCIDHSLPFVCMLLIQRRNILMETYIFDCQQPPYMPVQNSLFSLPLAYCYPLPSLYHSVCSTACSPLVACLTTVSLTELVVYGKSTQ